MTSKLPHIAKIVLNRPLYQSFDYMIPETMRREGVLCKGCRVEVPFGPRKAVGIIWDFAKESGCEREKLKLISRCLDEIPLFSSELLSLCQFASHYYHHPIGEVLFQALPAVLRRIKSYAVGRRMANIVHHKNNEQYSPFKMPDFELNEAQQFSVSQITKSLGTFQPFLLQGVTGSGKTEVYFHVIAESLKRGQQALVLVPEISLTPQTIRRFEQRFDVQIVCMHSAMTPKERLAAWEKAGSGEASIVVGTRSALFTGFKDLGVIVIDEEHDMSFKQQEGFRYSARDCAVIRARFEKIPIVLGTATPSLETLQNVDKAQYTLLSLPERAGTAVHPSYYVVDLRTETVKNGLSKTLIGAVRKHLERDNQVLLFLNRRGYAPTLMCPQCGWIAKCERCDVSFTLHKGWKQLRCHHCDMVKPIVSECPACHHKKLQQIGVGTERIEHALQKEFTDMPIVRIDRDTTQKKNAIHEMLETVHRGSRQILLGTQMIAKGHHFPNVTLVGVINFDAGFFSPDFRTAERMAQLLVQVAGRTGRGEKSGEVLIQTYYPRNPLLCTLVRKGYSDFAAETLQRRKSCRLPPYSYFTLIRAEAFKKENAANFLDTVREIGRKVPVPHIKLLGPVPAPLEKKRSYFRMQLLLQSASRLALQKFLTQLVPEIDALKIGKKVRWSLDVDPMEMV